MEIKSIFKSKTMWLNLAAGIVAISAMVNPELLGLIGVSAAAEPIILKGLGIAVAAANMYLRKNTTTTLAMPKEIKAVKAEENKVQ